MTDVHRPAAARLPRLRRTLGIAILCASLLSVLGGGCTWKASSGDHDDCKDLDDDGVCDEGGTVVVIDTVTLDESGDDDAAACLAGWAPSPIALVPPPFDAGYDLTGATLDPGGPGEPPVRRVRNILRVQFVTARDGALHDPSDLAAFTARVRAANPTLLALPSGAGSLRFGGIVTTSTLLAVTWQQLDPWTREIPGATQDFVFDHEGHLLQVENGTTGPRVSRPAERVPRADH